MTDENIALLKAEIVLDTLDEFDNKPNPKFREFLDTILIKWRNLNWQN